MKAKAVKEEENEEIQQCEKSYFAHAG